VHATDEMRAAVAAAEDGAAEGPGAGGRRAAVAPQYEIEEDAMLPYTYDEGVINWRKVCIRFGIIAVAAIGAAALALGIVLLVVSDSGLPAIDRYKAAVSQYDSSTRVAIGLWNGNVNGVTAEPRTVVLQGTNGAPTATSQYWVASLAWPSDSNAAAAFPIRTAFSPGPSINATFKLVETAASVAFGCTRALCAASVVGGNDTSACRAGTAAYVCSNATLLQGCRASYGADAVYTGLDWCAADSPCGSCIYTGYISAVCLVFTTQDQARSWVLDQTYLSCTYPFDRAAAYSSVRPAAIHAELRASTDPYFALLRETMGSGRFSDAPAQLSSGGLAAVIIGAIVLVAGIGCGIANVYLSVCRDDDDDIGRRRTAGQIVRGYKSRDSWENPRAVAVRFETMAAQRALRARELDERS
jgi:hypothetical protein